MEKKSAKDEECEKKEGSGQEEESEEEDFLSLESSSFDSLSFESANEDQPAEEESIEKEEHEKTQVSGKKKKSGKMAAWEEKEEHEKVKESMKKEGSGKDREHEKKAQQISVQEVLDSCRKLLVESIGYHIEPILDQLLADRTISTHGYEKIKSMKSTGTRHDCARELLDYIKQSGRSLEAYDSLKEGMTSAGLEDLVLMLKEAEKRTQRSQTGQTSVHSEVASESADPDTNKHPTQMHGVVTKVEFHLRQTIHQDVTSGQPEGGSYSVKYQITGSSTLPGGHGRKAHPEARHIEYSSGSKTMEYGDIVDDRTSPGPDSLRKQLSLVEGINMLLSGQQGLAREITSSDETCIMQPEGGAASKTSDGQESNRLPQGKKVERFKTQTKDVSLLLVGCTGNGKSSTGNTIVGKDVFTVSRKEGTKKYKREEICCRAPWNEKLEIKIGVTDTPGVSEQMTESEFQELEKAVKISQEGFDAIVLVWSERTTLSNKDKEDNVFKALHRMFGDSLFDHLFMVVTAITQDEVSGFYSDLSESLKTIKDKCLNTLAFDNKNKKVSEGSAWELILDAMNHSTKYGRYTKEHLSKECQVPLGDELRIALVGVTGAGKSSTANTIVGEEKFKTSSGASSKTKECSYEKRKKGDREIAVVDTPGVWDTDASMEEVSEEIARITTIFSAGLHALLLVIAFGRYTEQDARVVRILKVIFGETFMKYVVIVLTYKDKIDNDNELKGDLEKYIQTAPPKFQNLLQECNGRYVAFNNKTEDETVKRKQVTELVMLIDDTVRSNGGVPFTDSIFQEGQKEKDKIIEGIKVSTLHGVGNGKRKKKISTYGVSRTKGLKELEEMAREDATTHDLEGSSLFQIIMRILRSLKGSFFGKRV